ncbi:hypothetical protein L198_00069 [Cryptococcus wingfieldii CBS 7118]|uniref:Exonuclease domain-containing protein n=1 Tax=Cryptococcus wingfieldii CBS 7118 TaxID=1295528 RepID=A0A1E3K567_9TREE|nr:hypothetical protein L198_00069 [Cryptococcus wingfieldii CBS 7118]ODO08344.1 hypothetical protein L198_00069 [Cryptococcus wingfieldii CBS 7118]
MADSPRSSSSKRKTPPVDGTATDEDSFTKVPTRQEKRKQKKIDKRKPEFQFNVSDMRYGKKVTLAHVRDMVLYILAEAQKPQWLQIDHKASISHVVLLLIPGLLPEHLGLDPEVTHSSMPFPITSPSAPLDQVSLIPALSTLFTYGCPTRAPGDKTRMHSPINQLLMSPMSDAVKKQKEDESKVRNIPMQYLVTPNQMIDNDYQLPAYIKPSDVPGGWVETPEAKGPPADGKYPILAVDCEMVVSADGDELARVSVIDFETGDSIFDELVQPKAEITDYRTQWSGITPERLLSATHDLPAIQNLLLHGPSPIITPHTILLGHSLDCDLSALRIRHPLCIDTALIYKHPRGQPFKPGLKWLTQKWLGKDIQAGTEGHDSAEDARACVDLFKMKLIKGPSFGNSVNNMESIVERLGRSKTESGRARTSCYCDYGDPRWLYGAKATTAVQAHNDDDVVKSIVDNVEQHDFLFGRMLELSQVQGWNESDPTPDNSPETLNAALSSLSTRLSTLHASLPSNTALVIVTGNSNPIPMLDLQKKRQNWERVTKMKGSTGGMEGEERWMAEDERDLEGKVEDAKEGMAFLRIKS